MIIGMVIFVYSPTLIYKIFTPTEEHHLLGLFSYAGIIAVVTLWVGIKLGENRTQEKEVIT